ncbi:hypothetical protein N7497_005174 [Penicillium chrysogenum]|uniref:CCHC-type domain-containing protein n=1 Tax=Penicillium chrysogenum TaxID=5076 RepID=A0ABQ8WPB4_PENCH|nr:hypothetical protein N7505_003116 [Penicillium chrysogenum]KAJ5285063.1 hypothetical protein N7524_000369 [Penicillium chrysogenum]KAJ6156289.1 hypothetical protein N7497_005174 [Penicillium chrysogenum]
MGLVQLCRADGTGGCGGGVKKETRSCYFCKQRGHLRAKCPAALAIMGLVQLCRADGTLSESFELPRPAPTTRPQLANLAGAA